jgi:hypothetical protein
MVDCGRACADGQFRRCWWGFRVQSWDSRRSLFFDKPQVGDRNRNSSPYAQSMPLTVATVTQSHIWTASVRTQLIWRTQPTKLCPFYLIIARLFYLGATILHPNQLATHTIHPFHRHDTTDTAAPTTQSFLCLVLYFQVLVAARAFLQYPTLCNLMTRRRRPIRALSPKATTAPCQHVF